MAIGDWEGTDSPLTGYLLDSNERSLQSYQFKPEWIEEHARIEQAIAEGGYGHRQVYELVQNGADAMVHRAGGQIEVILTDTHLYCANEGDPIDQPGLEALLGSNMSRKRGDEIGRFGLGFKSVLAVTDAPEFFSRPVSLRFSREFSEEQIRTRVPAARDIPLPILRLGEPLEVATEAQSDPVLAELIDWSATVVRLRREPARDSSRLTTDLADFPAEFLLFTRHVSQLVLDDRTSDHKRTITVERGGDQVRLVEGQQDQQWQVFQKVVEPTREARIDGGVRAERDRLPIDWAVPTSGPSAIGKFWAFFPTTFETTLSGILNAPWKTNPDRENLLVGAFNVFLLDAAAELVVDKLQQVTSVEDPGRHLDRMPARGREARSWADRQITERIYDLAAQRLSLPDQRGQLTFPKDLRLHPERVPAEALLQWSSYPFRPHLWVHPSVETRERRPRVERLLEAARRDLDGPSDAIANYREWLEALAAPGSAEASAAALAVARLLQAHLSPVDFNEVKAARIVLSARGELVAPDPSRVFIGGHPDVPGTVAVHAGLVHDTFAERTLRETFGIVDVDRSAEFAAYVATAGDDARYWDELWKRADLIPVDEAKEIILRYYRPGDIQVRTIAGTLKPLRSVLLPGPVVQAGDDPDHTVHEDAHAGHLELVKALGATDVPRPDRDGFAGSPEWYPEYLEYVRASLRAAGRTVRSNTALESDHTDVPTHIEVLPDLSEEARARLTAELLRLATTRQSWTWRPSGGHQDQSIKLPSPAAWMLRHHGALLTTQGPRPVLGTVSASLSAFGRLLPVTRLSSEVTVVLGLPERIEDTPIEVLNEAFELLADETDDDLIGRFISAVAEQRPPPELLRCRVGLTHRNCPPTEVTAMVSSELSAQLRTVDTPIVLVPQHGDVERLAERWGLRREGDLVTQEIGYQLSTAEAPLIDEFPSLRLLAVMAAHQNTTLLRCSELTLTTRAAGGQTTEALERVVDGERIYWLIHDAGGPHREDAELLRYISDQLRLELTDTQIASLLKNREDEAQRRLKQLIRDQTDDIDRLLACLGAEALRRYVPSSLISAVEEQGHHPDDRMLAKMALTVHGVEILREAKSDLEQRQLQPPSQWAGGRAAQEFVRDLGFPHEYAGFPEDRRDQILEVVGPVELKKLHDFQAEVRDRFRGLLRTTDKTKRAMLSLPTGAGKTRVAVQSLVEHFAEGEIVGPVLWVAQSEELCEQAVQAWAEVWRAIGPSWALTISRLWDANSAEPVNGAPQVVVATIQKLDASVIEQPRYEWLAEAAVVVVDEAHRGATTPTTTRLLRWLGLEARGTDRCPLVGLTATPFIGTNEEQTKILAGRYGHTRLDKGLFPEGDTEQLITLLQKRRILSRVDHRGLHGVDIDLNESELDELNRFQRLPRAVEARLGVNAARNRTLVDSIKKHRDWQILLFAASVEHAQTLAALLRLEEITAAAITSETRPGARRHYVQQFKNRRIRVLTNYGTLTTGFDAPEVRAVYIARPTYSPNLYLQMIGRGLRGPINGGTEECLIVDVKDNVRMYGGKLAFTDFEFLWKRGTVA